MSQKEKVLEILSLSTLPEKAKIARLAASKVGKTFTLGHAMAVVRVYFPKGRLGELAEILNLEKHRQEKIRNDRKAVRKARELLDLPYTFWFRSESVGPMALTARKAEHIRHAQSMFGRDIDNNFGDDNLAMMSLIQGDIRRYTVSWLDGAGRPLPSALIEVGVMVDGIFRGQHRALLYKYNGRTMVAGTDAGSLRDAFADQVPTQLVALAHDLKEQGCTISTDFGAQEMVVATPEGEEKRMPWTGRTVD